MFKNKQDSKKQMEEDIKQEQAKLIRELSIWHPHKNIQDNKFIRRNGRINNERWEWYTQKLHTLHMDELTKLLNMCKASWNCEKYGFQKELKQVRSRERWGFERKAKSAKKTPRL